MDEQTRLASFGVRYFKAGTAARAASGAFDPYSYETFAGKHAVSIAAGDCAFYLSDDCKSAHLTRGPATIRSAHFATLVRGFAPENKSSSLLGSTVLPYINGCSTKQIFHPDRVGDPTLQMLLMPPHTSEQHHHVHSTARSVYILSGRGHCVVGVDGAVKFPLETGTVCVFSPMSAHHFETQDEALVVLPVHVWSSSSAEYDHPMFNGTFKI
ncbi:hypothetical protein BH10BDE1_BH10BDE1_16700 [soil metagenome]